MKLLLLALCAVAVAADLTVKDDLLHKQKAILKLLWKVQIPNPDQEQYRIGETYQPLQHYNNYLQFEKTKLEKLVNEVHQKKILPKHEVFSIFEKKQMQEARDLFELLYFSKNWETFYQTAAWARHHYNHGVFVYAFTTAVLHVPYQQVDLRGIELPKLYEILPNLYVPGKVVKKGYEAQYMQEDITMIPIERAHTRHTTVKDPQAFLDYFTEDMTLNQQYSIWHKSFPFWWNPERFSHDNNRQGELFMYLQHQILNRYHLERSAHRMPHVKALEGHHEIKQGYAPKMVYTNGVFMPNRPDFVKEKEYEHSKYVEAKDWEYRVKAAIDLGYVVTEDNQKVSLNSTEGMDILGRIIQGSNYQFKREYYGHLNTWAHKYYGQIQDPLYKYENVPSALQHFETAIRDPLFYRIQKTLNVLYKKYKDNLKPYTKEQLSFPGVEVQAVKVVGESRSSTPNTLITHFEEHQVDLSNVQNKEDTKVKGIVSRLRHEPFQYAITLNSKVTKPAFVRIYLAPKYDYLGNKYDINQKRWYAVEMDKFVVDLKQGQNVIRRGSMESSIVKKETETFRQLYQKVEEAIKNGEKYSEQKTVSNCGWPLHLLLPKGTKEGQKYTLYVVVTDYQEDRVPNTKIPTYQTPHSLCGLHHDTMYPDNKPMGYPFDRHIVSKEYFFQRNMMAVDVTVKNVM
uniref:Hexamerin 3 n=1 Tax=Lepidocampa weberi TaxID=165470 RepID=A0A4D6GI92_9HEXA|nr:hexamerin 3 precursor [Lepidocampa weberi]